MDLNRRSLWLLLLLGNSGCSIVSLLERTTDGIEDVSTSMRETDKSINAMHGELQRLQPSLEKLSQLDVPLREAVSLGPSLVQVGELRSQLDELATVRASLTEVAQLRDSAQKISALRPALEELLALRGTLDHVIATGADVGRLYELRTSLERLSGLEPKLLTLIESIDRIERVRTPLDRATISLGRVLDVFMPLVEAPLWLIVFWVLVALAALGGVVGFSTYAALRAADKQRARDALRRAA